VHTQPYLTLLFFERSAAFPKRNVLKERCRSLQSTSKPDEKRDRYCLLGRTAMEIGTSRGAYSMKLFERKLKPHTLLNVTAVPRFLCQGCMDVSLG